MAGFAGSGKLCADVVRVRGLLVVIQMTGLASSGKPLELADCRTLVAILALHGGVGAEQGKTILVIVDLSCGDLPAQNGVTLRAVGSHFPLVNVGVTILASFSDVGENRL
jgi:hypothetical protein